jgi:hypothetical protein
MPVSRRAEERLLSQDELELVSRTRGDALKSMDRSDITQLVRNLRERRDRAGALASRQRREMRGKADARGARPAGDNLGNVGKGDLLTSALKRLGKEMRRRDSRPKGQRAFAEKALRMKEAAGSTSTKPDDRTAGTGMNPTPRDEVAPSGALDHAGQRPAMHRAKFART